MTDRKALTYVEIDIPAFNQPDSPPNSPPDSPPLLTTFRFAVDSLYLPNTIDAIPSIIDVKLSPAILSLGQDLGQRANLTVRFRDHKHIFTTESFDSGTFWGKFRARYGLKLQGKTLRLIQGFVGQSLASMETREFTIDTTNGPSLDGVYQITAKDLFTLVDADKAQVPIPSNGFLSANITNVATSATLSPSGIGNSEYAASGFVNIGGKEVASFTRSGDVLTLTRAQFNTTAIAHNSQSRVQQCKQYSVMDVSDIIYDLLVNWGSIDSSLIPLSVWHAETAAYLNVAYSALITDPTAVNKLLSELIEQAGLVLWWDDLSAQFRLQVLRSISTDAQTYDESKIMEGSLKVTEQPNKRLSQVYVYFDKVNPLLKEDQLDNYRSTAFSSDTASEFDYGSSMIKKVYSRWIPSGGRAVANTLISILLSRFLDPPRRFNFDVFRDESGNVPLLAVGYQIGSYCFQTASGEDALLPMQVTSIRALPDRFEVEAEEMLFSGTPITGSSPGDHIVIIDSNISNVNLRTMHDSIYSTPTAGVTVTCTIQEGVIVGSTSTASPAFDTGTWPGGVAVNLIVIGRIEGCAGNGGAGGNSAPGFAGAGSSGSAGGKALQVSGAINLTDASGEIWGGGGGGGGGAGFSTVSAVLSGGGGGGGGGKDFGAGGAGGSSSGGAPGSGGSSGTTEAGGSGGLGAGSVFNGGAGGNPGSNGGAGVNNAAQGVPGGSGGTAGNAITGIASVTQIGATGDRRGAVV